MRAWWFALAALMLAAGARASAAPRPVVVELFTSQACSDCPPADALLRQLQTAHSGILALDLHVTYFNGPGWTDPFSFKAVTRRQDWYAALRHTSEVYTPQAVIDGHAVAVGSDRSAILRAIGQARQAAMRPMAEVTIVPADGGWRVAVSGKPPRHPATVEMFRFDRIDRTTVRGGENRGTHLTEIHVVRAITALGPWTGQRVDRRIPSGTARHIAVLVQQQDGTILGAASG